MASSADGSGAGGAPGPGAALATGRLLVASPALTDPNFVRAVVLLLDHDVNGTLGVVLNRPTTLDVGEVLPDWRGHATGEPVVYQGGPVALDSALGVAAVPSASRTPDPPGFRRVWGSVGLVDLDADADAVGAALIGLRIFAGYSGWGPGQLTAELGEGAWIVVDALPGDAFVPDSAVLWRSVLRRQPGQLAWLANYPDDPALN